MWQIWQQISPGRDLVNCAAMHSLAKVEVCAVSLFRLWLICVFNARLL